MFEQSFEQLLWLISRKNTRYVWLWSAPYNVSSTSMLLRSRRHECKICKKSKASYANHASNFRTYRSITEVYERVAKKKIPDHACSLILEICGDDLDGNEIEHLPSVNYTFPSTQFWVQDKRTNGVWLAGFQMRTLANGIQREKESVPEIQDLRWWSWRCVATFARIALRPWQVET